MWDICKLMPRSAFRAQERTSGTCHVWLFTEDVKTSRRVSAKLPHSKIESREPSREISDIKCVLWGLNNCSIPWIYSTAGFWSVKTTILLSSSYGAVRREWLHFPSWPMHIVFERAEMCHKLRFPSVLKQVLCKRMLCSNSTKRVFRLYRKYISLHNVFA